MRIKAIFIFLGFAVAGHAAEPTPSAPQSYETLIDQRLKEGLDFLQVKGWPSPDENPDFKQYMALLLCFKNEKVEDANRLVMEFCGLGQMTTYVGRPVSKNRSEALYRIYLLERTHRLLSPEARTAIEDYAWDTLNNHKLLYTSETNDIYESWAKFTELPKINGATINLNPEKTYDSPFLSMKHGTNKAVIQYPGYEDVTFDFNKNTVTDPKNP